jgi:hypothetical protein
MGLAVFLVFFVGVAVWVVRRRRRARVLAGLESTKPTFQVEPPRRYLGERKSELL